MKKMTVVQILKKFLVKHKMLTLLMSTALMFQVIGTLYVPFLVAELIDEGIAQKDLSLVASIGIEMVIVAILAGVAGILGSYYSAKFAAKFSYQARKDVFQKVQELSMSDMNQFGVSSLLTRTVNDIENIAEALVLFSQMILPAPFISLIAIYLTWTVSEKLVWIPILVITIFTLLTLVLVRKGNKYSVIIQEKMDRMVRSIREFYSGVRVIRAFNNESSEKKKTDQTFSDYASNMIQLNYLFAFLTPSVSALFGGAMTAIMWFGAFEVVGGTLEIGSITAIVEYTVLAIMYLIMAAMVILTLPSAYASLDRLRQVLVLDIEVKDPTHPLREDREDDQAVVRFEHVSFAYPDSEDPVLQEINFHVNRGETVAIVGSTGSGKSTIAKLLLRLNDVTSGSVMVNGIDVRKQKQFDLRKNISYVPQKSFLFNGTILENIQMGNEAATFTEIEAAAKTAQAASFIQTLEQQYDSFVAQGGSNYSGGQKQRLSIARALVKKADVYLFDDSFSALDYQTDKLVRQGIKQTLTDVAIIIVAQRLSTVIEADRIVLIDQGKVVGQGTHEELLRKNRLYQEFAISQQLLEEGDQR
ncbi:multidrug ABC transporter ATP-binding protein [Enterococcus alcedinis]|uniref:Multidrug ABC transporter ATP-binding protein n=2 Tax=Enterococcus alcedinis TaxID=1274384 RepID=A0A917JHQ3_9ENTE|nr:multidrug ABC transporter ATP-binding protein [Enterococcus alcedinis]